MFGKNCGMEDQGREMAEVGAAWRTAKQEMPFCGCCCRLHLKLAVQQREAHTR
jgi:hypothetical protein